jgi:multisubunit Na+/H+ antiporter MnhE subunit
MITTVVPGHRVERAGARQQRLLLHVFDAPDEAEFIRTLQARYEQPLMEIFES